MLLNIDIPKTANAFKDLLGEEGYEASFREFEKDGFFKNYEIGKFSEETFIWAFQNAIGPEHIQARAIIDAWNSMLLHLPRERLDMLERLKGRYGLYLFSNTNETHIRWFRNYLKAEYGIVDFDTRFFRRAYYSHLIQRRKPDVAAYKAVIADAGIRATETLFIDDNAENIKGAAAAGLLTLHHSEGDEIAEVLKDF